MYRYLQHVVSYMVQEWNTLTLPQQNVLERWFGTLWDVYEQEKKWGNTINSGWFQTPNGLELLEKPTDSGDNPPLYHVELARLPQVKVLDTVYSPALGSTSLDRQAFGETTGDLPKPEMLSWRLDLWLNPSGECPVRDGIQFICIKESNPLVPARYELDFLSGRKLSAFEANFVQSVFDASIQKRQRGK